MHAHKLFDAIKRQVLYCQNLNFSLIQIEFFPRETETKLSQ